MRKIIYNIFIIMLLFISSIALISCDAITAQNIKNTGSTPVNDGPGKNGNPDMNGKQGMNRNTMGN